MGARQVGANPEPPASEPRVPTYVELHLHTCYSFLDGVSRPEELAARAVQLGYETLAVTDHNGLYGAMEFAQACAAAGLRPITGVELTLRHGLLDHLSGPVHLTLLAESSRGYANLCRLVTEARRSSPRNTQNRHSRESGNPEARKRLDSRFRGNDVGMAPPLPQGNDGAKGGIRSLETEPLRDAVTLDPSFLEGHEEGVIALTGCRSGEVARLVDAGLLQEAAEAARRLAERFGHRNTFVELQHNLVRGDTRRVARLAELAAHLGLQIVATGDVHYHDRSLHRLQDALVAVRNHTTLEASHRLRRPNSEFFLRSPREVADLFAAYPEAIANTALIAGRCRGFDLADRAAIGYEFPDFARKPGEQHETADDVLARYCLSKFEERYPTGETDPTLLEKAERQLVEELRLVAKHRLSGFFLIYRDLQELATEVAREVRGAGTVRGASGLPPGRGRGSSVSSIICYLTGLSHVDPVKNRLFLNRFLNDDLQTVPDIDLDFPRDIREKLILRVYERYGHDHAALVCSFATYHLRSAVRDLGKVLDLPPTAIDKLARLSEGGKASSVREELDRLPEFQGQADGPLWTCLVELSEQLGGLPRHVGQHVGGMIISSRPLIELVPVEPAAMEGRFLCQWDKDSCDDARFIKIDFLALGMLSLVEECLELIWESRSEKVDLSAISYQDAAVYDAICRGDTVGMFQIESRAQIQMLTRTQPRNLDDLAVQVALVRPGPIVANAVNPYVRRREAQRRDPHYRPRADHPLLDDLLRDTLGVVLYQDQVMEVAIAMGGFTPGQADQFRRAMSRRRSLAAMEKFRESFLAGASAKGVPAEEAEPIFEKLLGFSEFGFPKSHSYAFAVLAYQSAWLRHYYPAEYYAALFNNQPMGFYSPHVLVGDAKRHGLSVIRVSINRSAARCTARYVTTEKPAQGAAGGCPEAGVQGAEPPLAGFGVSPNPLFSSLGSPKDGGYILLGLSTVQGMGEDLAKSIVAEREANGPYRSLSDLLRRTNVPYAIAEKLIAVGAMGEFGMSRRELLWQLGLLMPQSAPSISSTSSTLSAPQPRGPRRGIHRPRQFSLDLPVDQDMVSLQEMDDWDRMAADFDVLKLSPSFHPLGMLRDRLPGDILPSAALRVQRNGSRVRTGGLVVCRQRPGTARGILFLLLEDETGLTNVVVQPELYEAERSLLRGEPYLCIEGKIQISSGSLNLLAEKVTRLAVETAAELPRPLLRHSYPGHPHGPSRPSSPAPPETPASPLSSPDPGRPKLATPRSHDFR